MPGGCRDRSYHRWEKNRSTLCSSAVLHYPRAMDGAALNLLFDRIDAALARIDAIALRAPQGDDQLTVRHEQLRAAAAQTLRQLDALIAENSR